MPIFEYVCKNCAHPFEHLVLSSRDDAPTCPKCKSKKVQKLMSAGNVRPQGIPSGGGGFKPPKCAPSGS